MKGVKLMISYETFKELFEAIDSKYEAEMRLVFKDKNEEYMIIKYRDYISFQRCGGQNGSGEIRFKDLDMLYNTRTIDNILLKEDWDKIDDIIFDDMYSVLQDLEELKGNFEKI